MPINKGLKKYKQTISEIQNSQNGAYMIWKINKFIIKSESMNLEIISLSDQINQAIFTLSD